MKRICFILPKYAPENMGGAELQVYYLAKELVNKNLEVHYVREKTNNMLPVVIHEKIVLHSIPKQKYFFLQFLNLPFIWRAMREIKADYWYSRVSMWNLSMVSIFSKAIGGKVIWACSHDREVSAFSSRTNSSVKQFFERIEHFFFIRALRKIDCRLVQTERQQHLLKSNYSLDSFILQNSHPVPCLKETNREKAIVWVANMRDFKRPELYIELAKILAPYQVKCIMIGAVADKELQHQLTDTVTNYPNFCYKGSLPVEKVYETMNCCKIFINTSTEEGFPNTFIQAWMCGIPVITLGVDPSDIIRNHNIGIICTSVNEMKESVLQLLNNEQQWLDFSQRSRQFAVKHFDIQAYVQKFLKLIEPQN